MNEQKTFEKAIFELMAMKLILESDEETRKMFASLKDTPHTILKKLTEDESVEVRIQARKTLDTPVEAFEEIEVDLKKYSYKERIELAQDSQTPQYILVKLSRDNHKYVRRAVAENPSTPEQTLEELSNEQFAYMREAVAKNKSTSLATLEKLKRDKSTMVQKAAIKNFEGRTQKVHD